MTPDENDVPGELRRRNQWANWASLSEDELPEYLRHPKQPYFGPTRELSWTTEDGSGPYHRAFGHTTRHENRGVGYVFSEDDEYVAIDLDGCLDDYHNLKEWCPKPPWLTEDVWVEVSSSETGLHTAVKGVSLPWWWSNQDFEDKDHAGVECEDGNRFFALTGDLWKNHGTTIPDVDEETFYGWLKDVCREVSGTPRGNVNRPSRRLAPLRRT